LLDGRAERTVFDRLVSKSRIEHRYSVLAPAADPTGDSVDAERFYSRGRFPSTGVRMRRYERHAPVLAMKAVSQLDLPPAELQRITHLIVTSCTGLYAPGLDLELVSRCGLPPSVERTMVGFMGCYAAINGLKLANHIVRSRRESRVLLVNLELCSLHLKETKSLERLLSFLLFADGCAASIVSRDPSGLAIDSFYAALVPDTRELITWNIRDDGFDMLLSGAVPGAIAAGLEAAAGAILNGVPKSAIDRWAVHPGGRSVLDAVERGLGIGPEALATSRGVLESYGNMSSATVMFVLQSMLARSSPGERGCAMSFGPGLTAETMMFHKASE
jgi:predicted naringenin-chalcone synthase